MVETGRILRFDEMRGYGFISSSHGGEDVFMHANDFLDDKSLYTPGSVVEYTVEEGDRGLKACDVQVVQHVPASGSATPRESASPAKTPAPSQLSRELTEFLLEADPTLTGAQIVRLRKRLVEFATDHDWTL
ncbi:MAG: cold shock domain-containing protein [Catenulispora sp.]|nr:cold shock domain-containing protein [Catenulispora sp.]